MRSAKTTPATLALILILISPLVIKSQQTPAADKPASGTEVVTLAGPGPIVRLLPDTLAGFKATSEIRQVVKDNLAELVAENSAIYQEYLVNSAVSREYSGTRIEVFETRNQFAALGLFTFTSGVDKAKPGEIALGSRDSVTALPVSRTENELLFSQGVFFVRVINANQKNPRGGSAVHQALARAVAEAIAPSSSAGIRPPLLDSLPATLPGASLAPQSQRYFLGAESLNAFVEHGRDMFEFVGDTEAVVGEYSKVEGDNTGAAQGKAAGQTKAGGATPSPSSPGIAPMKLVIVECHTPEFATDELARVTSYVSSLPEPEQQRIVFKRTGNYILAAVGVRDREFAEGLINSVQYPYTVKWLRNPLWPTNDPFRIQKAGDMLVSTFGLLGLILLTVLAGGTIFGTSVFLKRRKQQREVFSDAGGMLRLDIEPFILALPPKRDE